MKFIVLITIFISLAHVTRGVHLRSKINAVKTLKNNVQIEQNVQNTQNVYISNAHRVGGWGGLCTCPDGQKYWVGDNYDACRSLACVNGHSGQCYRRGGPWSRKKVTCGSVKSLTKLHNEQILSLTTKFSKKEEEYKTSERNKEHKIKEKEQKIRYLETKYSKEEETSKHHIATFKIQEEKHKIYETNFSTLKNSHNRQISDLHSQYSKQMRDANTQALQAAELKAALTVAAIDNDRRKSLQELKQEHDEELQLLHGPKAQLVQQMRKITENKDEQIRRLEQEQQKLNAVLLNERRESYKSAQVQKKLASKLLQQSKMKVQYLNMIQAMEETMQNGKRNIHDKTMKINHLQAEVAKLAKLNVAKLNVYTPNAHRGGWGGQCTCPDGQKYWVGDNYDSCRSLACVNGHSGQCYRRGGPWSRKKVTCGSVKYAELHEIQKSLERDQEIEKNHARKLSETKQKLRQVNKESITETQVHFQGLEAHHDIAEKRLLGHEQAYLARNMNKCIKLQKPKNKCFKVLQPCGAGAIARWEIEFYPGGNFIPILHNVKKINKTILNGYSVKDESDFNRRNYSVTKPAFNAPIMDAKETKGKPIINFTLLEHVRGRRFYEPVETMYRFNCNDKADPTYHTFLCDLIRHENDECNCKNEPTVPFIIPGYEIDNFGNIIESQVKGRLRCIGDQYFPELEIVETSPKQSYFEQYGSYDPKEDAFQQNVTNLGSNPSKNVPRRRRLLQNSQKGS